MKVEDLSHPSIPDCNSSVQGKGTRDLLHCVPVLIRIHGKVALLSGLSSLIFFQSLYWSRNRVKKLTIPNTIPILSSSFCSIFLITSYVLISDTLCQKTKQLHSIFLSVFRSFIHHEQLNKQQFWQQYQRACLCRHFVPRAEHFWAPPAAVTKLVSLLGPDWQILLSLH